MKKCINIAIWLQLVIISYVNAQMYDANWVFGTNAGINFSNPDTPYIFNLKCSNHEHNASISNVRGELLYYFSSYFSSGMYNSRSLLNDTQNSLIVNGDSLNASYNITSGAISIKSTTSEKYITFHLNNQGNADGLCNGAYCSYVYVSFIGFSNMNELLVDKKNTLLIQEAMYSKMSAVKHANGKDWWLILHTEKLFNNQFQNTFIRFLISDTIITGPYYQQIGSARNQLGDISGQMKISQKGNKLALARHDSRVIETYDINRCTGELSNAKSKVVIAPNYYYSYGLEFSSNEDYLYISAYKPQSRGGGAKLYQVAIHDTLGLNQLEIYSDSVCFGQLQIAPNNKIYVAGMKRLSINPPLDNYSQNLSVINQPDSVGLACDFQPFSFYLGDSSKSSVGLPNFPNYRLGALSIYEADAGRDTVLCIDSTINQKVVQLGSPKVDGVQYQWYPNYNLSSDTAAQPLAYPDSTTMYYVMLSDTSIKNACKTRLDSVWVEVRKCNTSAHGQLSTDHSVKVFPNPASSEIKIESEWYKIQNVSIYDVTGKALLSPFEGGACSHCVQAGDEVIINIKELSQGIYFIQTQLANGQTTINKLVKQ